MKEGYTEAAVDFLISDLPKRALTKHKKETETSVNPEEDQGFEDHDESLNFDSQIITCIEQLKCQLFVIRIFSYMNRIIFEVSCIWTEY